MLLAQGLAAIVQGGGKIRLEPQGAHKGGRGLVKTTQAFEDIAAIVVGDEIIRLQRHRAVEGGQRLAGTALLGAQDAQRIAGLGIAGPGGENPQIAARGLRQLPGPMRRHRPVIKGLKVHAAS